MCRDISQNILVLTSFVAANFAFLTYDFDESGVIARRIQWSVEYGEIIPIEVIPIDVPIDNLDALLAARTWRRRGRCFALIDCYGVW